MKKWLVLLLALGLLGLSACGSGTASTEETAEPETLVAEPLPHNVDMENLTNANVAVSFDPKTDIHMGESATIDLTIYAPECYDPETIAQLKVGDTIVSQGESIVINTMEKQEGILSINDNQEGYVFSLITGEAMREAGREFIPGDDSAWYTIPMDVYFVYDAVGQVSLPVAEDFVCTDHANWDGGGQKYTLEDLSGRLGDGLSGRIGFDPQNTSVHIENGVVTEMLREYTP